MLETKESYPVLGLNPEVDGLVAQAQPYFMDINRQSMLNEMLGFLNKFILESTAWRRSSFEADWHLFERNSDSIYDPALLVKKETWQSRAFMPMTASHRENIKAALFRMMMGARPPVEIRARVDRGDADQSDNIRDLILREMERSRFEVEIDKILDDASTYGSGFCRIRWEETLEDRVIRQQRAVTPAPKELIANFIMGRKSQQMYSGVPQKVVTYRGVKIEWLNIWDIFPDPKALVIKGNQIAYRFKIRYGDIVAGVKQGYYFPEAISIMRNYPSMEREPVDLAVVRADRSMAPSNPPRTDYGRQHECYEWYGRLPKKWVLLDQNVEDPETLMPARVLFNSNVVLCIEPSDVYDGEPPIYKMDYLPVGWRFYGRGVPEMLKAIQEVFNETINQRIDNVALVLNKMFAVIEKAMVSADDLVSKPGGIIRLDARFVQDVRQAFMSIDIPDVTMSAYKDVQELERYAQERTSANRVTLGTNGLVNDANRTATGLEILRQSAGEKFTYIGMLIEFVFLYEVFRAYWKTIYANIQPDDVVNALGEQRAQTFQLLTPEDIEEQYVYEPQGVFTMENKALTQMKLQGLDQEFGNMPWLDRMAIFDKECKSLNFDPQTLKLSPAQMQQMMMAQENMETPRPQAPTPGAQPAHAGGKPSAGTNPNQEKPSPAQAMQPQGGATTS